MQKEKLEALSEEQRPRFLAAAFELIRARKALDALSAEENTLSGPPFDDLNAKSHSIRRDHEVALLAYQNLARELGFEL
jgi:hypothetical protein